MKRWDFGVFYVGVFLSLECICGKPEIGFWAAGGCREFAISFSFGKSVLAAEAGAEQRRGAQRRYCKPRARHGAWGWHCKPWVITVSTVSHGAGVLPGVGWSLDALDASCTFWAVIGCFWGLG